MQKINGFSPARIRSALLFQAIVIAALALPLRCLEPGLAVNGYVDRIWTAGNGLPQSTVFSLLQNRDGFIWIGTDGGLARFDGSAFTLYKHSNTALLSSNSITALLENPPGVIWIGSLGGGLLRLEDGRFEHFGVEQGLPSPNIWTLQNDTDGRLWIGTTDKGVAVMTDRRVAFALSGVLPDPAVMALCRDTTGAMWIGTRKGLSCWRDGRVESFGESDGLLSAHIIRIYLDRKNTLWTATSKGLCRKSGNRFIPAGAGNALGECLVRAIVEDGTGDLWLGSDKGLFYIRDNRVRPSAASALLSDQTVLSLLLDREGNLFVGTGAGGLNRLAASLVTRYSIPDGLPDERITPVMEDRSGTLWVGSRHSGMHQLNDGRFKPVIRSGLPGNADVSSLLQDRRGRIWIGTTNLGLLRQDGDRFIPCGLTTEAVPALLEDRQGRIWAGSGSGLFLLQDDRPTRLVGPDGLSLAVTALAEDENGTIWVGTRGSGLFSWTNGQWKSYSRPGEWNCRSVLALRTVAASGVWIGTDNGLFHLAGGHFSACSFLNGPLDMQIFAILPDRQGNLWLSGNRGIIRLAAAILHSLPEGPTIPLPARLLGETDGLGTSVCSGDVQPAAWCGTDGRLWFATQKGLAMLDPSAPALAGMPPAPVITGVSGDDLFYPSPGVPRTMTGASRLEFHFSAPCFTQPERVYFKFRLLGFDSEWHSGAAGSFGYAHLPSGDVTFQVMSLLDSGEANPHPASLSLHISPPDRVTLWPYWVLLVLTVTTATVLFRAIRRGSTPDETSREKYRFSNLPPEKEDEYCTRLAQLMETGKPYLDPDLSLTGLAELLVIPVKHLSQVINARCGQNFNDYINAFRIRDAQLKLADPRSSRDKLLKIAFECGFNSKSVFNAAFKKQSGKSPSEYRRDAASRA